MMMMISRGSIYIFVTETTYLGSFYWTLFNVPHHIVKRIARTQRLPIRDDARSVTVSH